MADSWDSVSKAAMKILGDKGKIPKPGGAVGKAKTADDKAYVEFKKTREELKDKLLALQNTGQSYADAVAQFQDQVDEDDLGLDPKNKDDAKSIAAARKVLSAFLQENVDNGATNYKNLRELDKHLMSLTNYKPES